MNYCSTVVVVLQYSNPVLVSRPMFGGLGLDIDIGSLILRREGASVDVGIFLFML